MNALVKCVLGPDGLPLAPSAQAQSTAVNKAMMTAYAAAATSGSRTMGGWNRGLTSADGAYLPERDALVGGARKMVKNSGWVAGAIQTSQDAMIGPSPRVMADPNWKALGLSPEWAEEFGEQCEARFSLWADDPLNRCDVERQTNFGGLLNLTARHRLIDGEGVMLPYARERGGSSSLALRILDPDRLSNPDGRPDDDQLRRGVALDRDGAAKGYHIRSVHPSDTFGWGRANAYKWDYVPAYTSWGRRRFIHAFEASQASQHRGVPLLAPVMERLHMEDKYAKAELEAAILNAVMAAFIKSPLDPALALGSLQTGGDPVGGDPAAYQMERLKFHQASDLDFGGAQVGHLYPGEEMIFSRSERPNSAYPEFEATALRYVSAGLGLSYEQLSHDWSQSNYSSARGALVEAYKFLTARRTPFVKATATQVYVLWLEEELATGRIELPSGAPPFHQAVAAYARCEWIGPPRGWVDPVKEGQGSDIRMAIGVSTLKRECMEQGLDYREVARQRSRERKLLASLDLPMPSRTVVVNSVPEEDDLSPRMEAHIAKMESLRDRAAARAGASRNTHVT